ncbi:MAG: hypothetical protein WAM91_02605 [Candidatus Acidiferrales bacterium]
MRGFGPIGAMNGMWCRTAICALAVTAIGAGAVAQSWQGEQGPPSLGAIARQLRAQKPATQTAKKIWTNDNIPKNPFGISVVGPPPPPPEDAAVRPAAPPSTPAAKPKTQAELEPELAQEQQKLETLEKELDLAKRDYLLQQQGFYTNPMASQDPQIQAQLAQAQQQIDAKQQDVDIAKGKVAELQRALDDAKKNPTAPAPPKPQENPSQN